MDNIKKMMHVAAGNCVPGIFSFFKFYSGIIKRIKSPP